MATRTVSILLILSSTLLAGCGLRIQVLVNGFQNPEQPLPQTATYSIVPLENQKNDLEFLGYARMVERKIQERGYKKADPKDADLAVMLIYGIDQGTVAHTSAYSDLKRDAFGNIVGSEVHAKSYKEYERTLTITVVDAARYRKDGTIVSLWRGQITSSGSSGDLRLVMPFMIEAGFRHWSEDTKLGIRHVLFEDEQAVIKLRDDKP